MATLAVAASVVHVAMWAAALWKLRQPTPSGAMPPLSVFKPLRAIDEGLYENLASLMRQDYPCFEVIVGVADASDPVLAVVRQLRREFPRIPLQLAVGVAPTLANPKVMNLLNMARHARHDWWLISDANVRLAPDYLRSIAAHTSDDRVGLVANLIVGKGATRLGALLENLQLNTTLLPAIAAADVFVGHPCVVGKSMLLRRQALQAIGGLYSLAPYLAEDYLMGRWIRETGYRVVMSSYLVATHNANWSLARFWQRHLRWNQLRRRVSPGIYALEPLMNPAPLWLLVATLADASPWRWGALAAIAVRLTLDAALLARLEGRPARGAELLLMLPKDLLQLVMWAVAWGASTVRWRGQRFRLGAMTRLHPLSARRSTASVSPGAATVGWASQVRRVSERRAA